MDWQRHKTTWPFAEHSRFVDVAPHRWHIQQFGQGPTALFLHGAGGATQSFRHLAPLLSNLFEVVLIDLPGQGFTKLGTRHRSSLPSTTQDLQRLLEHEKIDPELVISHSAGAAIALSMALNALSAPIVGINPALERFEGTAGWAFPFLAKILSLNPFVPGIFAKVTARKDRVEGLLASIGSPLNPDDTALYQSLMSEHSHIDGTLLMMANWSVDQLAASLHKIQVPVLFITGERDGAVPPKVARDAAGRIDGARQYTIRHHGHLVHETEPKIVAEQILKFASDTGLVQESNV